MGTPDIQQPLRTWINSLERFSKGSPIKLSLIADITSDVNYFNQHDRISFLNENDNFSMIPRPILMQMIGDFLYKDVTSSYARFFKPQFQQDKQFMYDMSMGFLPRFFNSYDHEDRVIYEEGQEVNEMYFIMKGLIGFAINNFSFTIGGPYFKIGRKQSGK